MVAATWRLYRLWGMETAALEREMDRITPELEQKYEVFKEDSRLCVAMQSLMEDSRILNNFSRHESRLARMYHRALQTLLRLRANLPGAPGAGVPGAEKNTRNEPGPPPPASAPAPAHAPQAPASDAVPTLPIANTGSAGPAPSPHSVAPAPDSPPPSGTRPAPRSAPVLQPGQPQTLSLAPIPSERPTPDA
jgi:hypothetical protein